MPHSTALSRLEQLGREAAGILLLRAPADFEAGESLGRVLRSLEHGQRTSWRSG